MMNILAIVGIGTLVISAVMLIGGIAMNIVMELSDRKEA